MSTGKRNISWQRCLAVVLGNKTEFKIKNKRRYSYNISQKYTFLNSPCFTEICFLSSRNLFSFNF